MNDQQGIHNNIRIIVFMSTYNGERYIDEQVKSILGQTISEQLVIKIRDDGSTDRTCEIIENLLNRYPGKISLIRGKNIGYNASFFDLINNTYGYDYYSIADQDDIWFCNKLEVAITELEKYDHEVPLLYSSTSCIVDKDLIPLGQTRKKIRDFKLYNTVIQNICPGHTQVFNNALHIRLQNDLIITSRIYVYDSWIVNIAMIYGRIIFSNNYYAYYRQHKNNKFGSVPGCIGKILVSWARIKAKDGLKNRTQIRYLLERNREELQKQNLYDELQDYINARTFKERLRYLMRCKLYRQTKIETLLFYIAVMIKQC